jgi:RNA polymerase sigma-70 factor, ECF subfamily
MQVDERTPEAPNLGDGGDSLSPDELCRAFRPTVFAICLANVRNHHDAEDMTQEVFVKALANMQALRDPSRVRAWLLQIARRTCVDHYRRKEPAMPSVPQDVAARPAEQNPLVDRLHQALGHLPTDYRETIALYYLDGRSCATVASCLGITEPAARQRLVRARLMLHDLLREEQP